MNKITKKLCVVNYIYGEKYQGFIPLYIISLKESYPEYDIRLYIDNTLNENTKEAVNILSEHYGGIFIVENYAQHTKFTEKAASIQQIQRCQRWLFYDEAFLDYEAIYIGDIDLLICKEEKPLFEQHKLHCETVGAPYSNIKRTEPVKKYNFKIAVRNFVKFGFKQTLKYYFSKTTPPSKFSGLHFVLTKEYYGKIRDLIDDYYNELNLLAEGKSKRYNLCNFNNEAFLRDIIISAGFCDCKEACGKNYNLETDATLAAYRPHHGIHLGIFRHPSLIENENALITSKLYLSYYRQFKDMKKCEVYNKVSKYFTSHLNNLIEIMEDFYYKYEGTCNDE